MTTKDPFAADSLRLLASWMENNHAIVCDEECEIVDALRAYAGSLERAPNNPEACHRSPLGVHVYRGIDSGCYHCGAPMKAYDQDQPPPNVHECCFRGCAEPVIANTLWGLICNTHSYRLAPTPDVQRDAERYRWLRNESEFAAPVSEMMTWVVYGHDVDDALPVFGNDLDKALDAARAAEKK